MSLIETKVKEAMQTGMKNMGSDHNVNPHHVQIIIYRKADDMETPCYKYAIDWITQKEVNLTTDLLRPTFGIDLMMREEIAKQFIPKKLKNIAKDYNVPDDEKLKVIVVAQTEDLQKLLLIPYYENKQITKDGIPITLPFEYILEL